MTPFGFDLENANLYINSIASPMSNKTRSVVKIIAVVLVVLAIVMHQGWVSIPLINGYRFWMAVLSALMLLAVSK